MKNRTRVILKCLMWMAVAAPTTASHAGDGTETEAARKQRIQWWREARFGMFIHWGLYAIPGGVWKNSVHEKGYSEWIMFDEKIPAKEYSGLASRFNPVKFDARSWTATAQKAGMKYVVLTTKHHDGFSMFDSRLTGYDVMDATPFKRDVTLELSEACRDSGIRFGCYYSIDRDWYRPQGPGNGYKQTNTWDYPDSKPADFDRYLAEFAKPQIEELLTRYHPDLMWFDDIDMKNDVQVADLYQTIRKLRPACVLNSRIQGCRFPAKIPPPHCDYISTGDNEILGESLDFEWENPASMNTSYGFNRNDHNWVETGEIIHRLIDIVSKGGNYLLNVGPDPDGLIPQPCVDRLMETGTWMETNGEAIHGTSPWKIHGEEAKGEEGPVGVRFTAKGDSLHVICMKWPGAGLVVRSLGTQALPNRTVRRVRMLGSAEEIRWRQTAAGLELGAPAGKPCDHAFVYRIDLTPASSE